jgi:hypothetical protein
MFGKRKQLDEWGKKVEALRQEIPVNQELKSRLRTEFESQPVSRKKPTLAYAAVLTVAMALALWLGLGNRETGHLNPVLAADLKIINHVSLVDIASGSNLPPVIGTDKLYIPVADQGTFILPLQSDKQAGTNKITDSNILFNALSHDGKTAAYTNSKGIYLYDLDSGETRTLIEGNDYDLFYEEPSWSADDQTLLITRRKIEWLEHGFNVKSLDICEINRDGRNLRKIASGNKASFVPRSEDILFERDGMILVRKADGDEQVVDEGRFPSVSPDGFYIAYVKSIQDEKKLSETASVITDLSDVYICSVNNFADGKKLTANYPFRHTDEEEWAKNLDPAHGEQSLVFGGMYDFYNPVWGTDSSTLYVLKGGNSENIPMRITRINLSPKTLAAEDTVARYLEAGITRDDDFARSLLTDPSGYFTISNPHPVAYSITSTGEENGQPYVDARRTVAYNADSYYVLSHIRFYLVKSEEGYKIERTAGREGGVQVFGRDDGIYIREGDEDQERMLLPVKGVTPPGADNMRRLSSLAYSPEKQLLLYTIQEPESFTVFAHDLKQNREVFSQKIADGESAVMDLSFNGSHQYAAIRYYGDSHQSVKLYDVRKKAFAHAPFLDNAMNAFWAGEKLLVETAGAGGTIRWIYDPKTARAIIGG